MKALAAVAFAVIALAITDATFFRGKYTDGFMRMTGDIYRKAMR